MILSRSEKRCGVCKVVKLVSEYYATAKGSPAFLCKECHKARMKERRLTNANVQEYDRLRYHSPERKLKTAKIAQRWRERFPEAYKAQTAVNNAVRDGRLSKAPCSICGSEKNVQAHHKDYSKPLDVVWMCAKCHHRVHAVFPELGGHYGIAR